jgi:hypothetical protein
MSSAARAASKGSELRIEHDVPSDTDLVRRDAPLEEVRELLYVLERHKRERVRAAVARREPESREPLIGHMLEVSAHVFAPETEYAAARWIAGEGELRRMLRLVASFALHRVPPPFEARSRGLRARSKPDSPARRSSARGNRILDRKRGL